MLKEFQATSIFCSLKPFINTAFCHLVFVFFLFFLFFKKWQNHAGKENIFSLTASLPAYQNPTEQAWLASLTDSSHSNTFWARHEPTENHSKFHPKTYYSNTQHNKQHHIVLVLHVELNFKKGSFYYTFQREVFQYLSLILGILHVFIFCSPLFLLIRISAKNHRKLFCQKMEREMKKKKGRE